MSYALFSQDNIETSEKEKINLKFQERFFAALTDKAIGNYQKAIRNLENCNQLLPNNKAILFELSKNYLLLQKTPEAVEYAKQALLLEPSNIWILEHLVKVYKKEYNFKKAIVIQEKIAVIHPKKKQQLVYLHLQNNDKSSAKELLNDLAKSKMLSTRLRKIKTQLATQKQTKKVKRKETINSDLKTKFTKEKSFKSLQKLLVDLDSKNDSELLKYCKIGLTLFPAQPFIYLMNGKVLNKNKKYKYAIDSLQNGIDFIIDNPTMEITFYNQLIIAYKALGDKKNTRKYQNKIK